MYTCIKFDGKFNLVYLTKILFFNIFNYTNSVTWKLGKTELFP